MKIDAHQHFWELDRFDYQWLSPAEMQPICRDYRPQDLEPHLKRHGIERSIYVQTQHDLAENRWALSLCEQHDFLAGVVGWVDLQSPECAEQLAEFVGHPQFLGIRHIVQDEPDDDFIVRPDTLRGLKTLERQNIPYDLLFYTRQLRHAATVAGLCPELPLVIDHLAKPNIRQQEWAGWIDSLRAAAEYENVYCKLSGLVTEAAWRQWTPAQMEPYMQAALEAFGPDRLMYGSDWPVCELSASYAEVFGLVEEFIRQLSADEQAKILGETAARFYRLSV